MAVRVSEDVVTLSDFKARAPELLKRAVKTKQPVVLTQNGRPAGVVLSPAEYDRLTEHERIVSLVRRGMEDVKAGRMLDSADVKAEMKRRFGGKKR